MNKEYINNGVGVMSYEGIDTARIEKVLDFATLYQKEDLSFVHRAMTRMKPIPTEIFMNAKKHVEYLEIVIQEAHKRVSQEQYPQNNFIEIVNNVLGEMLKVCGLLFLYIVFKKE